MGEVGWEDPLYKVPKYYADATPSQELLVCTSRIQTFLHSMDARRHESLVPPHLPLIFLARRPTLVVVQDSVF